MGIQASTQSIERTLIRSGSFVEGTGLGDMILWQGEYHEKKKIARRIVRISMTENHFLFLIQQKKRFKK